jgi:replication factor C subunit 1
MPFMKASNVAAPAKTAFTKPDLEEAIEEDDGMEEVVEAKEDDDETDLKKDKYIKQPKAKKGATGKKGASKKKAAKDEDDEDDFDSEQDVKPRKGNGKAAAKRKGKK